MTARSAAPPDSERSRPVHDCWNRIGVRGDQTCVELSRHTHCRNCPVYGAAAIALLDRPLPDESRSSWTAQYAGTRRDTSRVTASVLVFRIGEEWLALPTASVHEVSDPRPIHVLPRRRNAAEGRPAGAGLVNVRGDLVIHVSLAALLAIDGRDRDEKRSSHRWMPRLVVVGDAATRLAFDAHEVLQVQGYDPAQLRPVPSTIGRARMTYTTGMLVVGDHTVGCLAAGRTLRALAARLG